MFACLDVEMTEETVRQKSNYILQKRNRAGGFTLVEMLVVISIIVLISGSILAGYNTGQKRYSVATASQRLMVDIRRAQNMALAGATQGAIIPAGYGIHTDSNSQYFLFYNTAAVKKYTFGASAVMETISLPTGVSISPLNEDIYFVPADPKTYINEGALTQQSFTLNNSDINQTVTVHDSGMIE
ncbi:MAG: hypothetical protein A3B04_00575 [Candidatus Portnoybacteria bacterium RIFCSPLOWO2_02_FULL_39_11]|uniref:General secretion pathway GspH domain-containing protein n=1 Tax=Candidatus Portnoybacteria bacterium RIFCSPLOWO2_02_FULL_39_11 TaxID=1802001 RepID=A0A1G2FT11_9BACT|nr:MAG: hypothetical protein A3B04_00575 [Candidatus Portnoybacteria bacterium RIFCSPLOWO2_02_FULL_39_11]